jgi:hypothetical protein
MKWFWVFVGLSLLINLFLAYKEFSPVLISSFLNILAIIILYIESRKDEYLARIEKKIDSININKVSEKIDALRDEQTSSLLKAFEVEMELSKYKYEQEEKYREVVKKVLELDNKLNEKYELLGKSIIKLSKDIKKS